MSNILPAGSRHHITQLVEALEPACARGRCTLRSGQATSLTLALALWLTLLAVFAAPANAVSVATFGSHNLLLRDDGTVWAWGRNADGELGDGTTVSRASPAPVPNLSGVKAIAAGWGFSLALKADGSVWAWGSNDQGQLGDGTTVSRDVPVPIPNLSGVQAIAAGGLHSLAITAEGTVLAWGNSEANGVRRAVPFAVQNLSGVRAIAAGASGFSLALKADGTVWAWGFNFSGELGDGTTVSRAQPAPVPNLSGVQAIAAGNSHSLALKTDGTLLAWGLNTSGQLGDGTTVSRATPAPVPTLNAVQAIAAGGHSLALKTDGTTWAWGGNFAGQLGDGTTVGRATPLRVPDLEGVQGIVAGEFHSVALRMDGTLSAWGDNFYGQLGDGTTVSREAPVQVPDLNRVQTIVAGVSHSLALKTDGTLWAWGDNSFGELGDGTTVTRAAPAQVTDLTGVRAVAAGGFHSIALVADGTVRTWGTNFLSDGDVSGGEIVSSPQSVPNLNGVQAIATGSNHSLALKTDGTVSAWGDNGSGQLGDGTYVARASALSVPNLSGVRAIAAGADHSLALMANGTVWAWGSNLAGQLGDGTAVGRQTPAPVPNLDNVQAIAAGLYHSLALKTDGSVWVWGYSHEFQGVSVTQQPPVQVASLPGVQAIAAAGYRSSALANGSVWEWGTVTYSAQSLPRQNLFLNDIQRIAVGPQHALVLTADDRVLAWGSNALQKLGITRFLQSLIPVDVRDPLAPYANADLVTEYFNPTITNGAGTAGIGHYFITAASAEAASIDAGGSGPGWSRTGRTFRAWNDRAKAPVGAVGVCRFYARAPNSHFYTASAEECQSLKSQNPTNDPNVGWSFEGIAFYTVLPAAGSCGPAFQPVYRSFNNRFDPNPVLTDSNHRITPSYNDYRRSIRFFGYVDEGIAFCSPISPRKGGDLQTTFSYPGATVQAGALIAAEFLFGNNGAGRADGGTIYVALPAEVGDWNVTCTSTNGGTCPSTSNLTRLREGLTIADWPAGSTLNFTALGTAPHVAAGENATLTFAAIVANASGSPDSTPSNDAPPRAHTVVKTTAVCNTVLNPNALQLGPAAQTARINLVIGEGCTWSAQSGEPWISVGAANGTGDATLTLTMTANGSIDQRDGIVSINGKTILVTQSGIPCTFVANPATLAIAAAGQTSMVALAAPTGCKWAARSNAPWLSVNPVTGSGNATLAITVQANSEPAGRNVSVSLENLTIPVAQAGAGGATPATPLPSPDPCLNYRIVPEGHEINANGLTGSLSIDVVADSRCAWEAQSNASWITVTSGSGGRGNGVVRYTVEPNPNSDSRRGTLTIGVKTFTVNQHADYGNSSTGGSSDSNDGNSGNGAG